MMQKKPFRMIEFDAIFRSPAVPVTVTRGASNKLGNVSSF